MTGVLKVRDLIVSYGQHRAVDNVSVEFRSGSIHALLGANGSGKSSLLKALAGVCEGAARMQVSGPRAPHVLTQLSPARARDLGLRFVHQDLGLIEEQSVLDNVFLDARPPAFLGQVRWRAAREEVERVLASVALDVSPLAPMTGLPPSSRLLVAVARALLDLPDDGGFIFLDEPTAGLDEREAAELLRHLRGLADSRGIGIVLVTHRLRDVEECADEVTVLRDGVVADRLERADIDAARLVAALGGRVPGDPEPPPRAETGISSEGRVLELNNLSGRRLRAIDLSVLPGEILGFTGLEGSGKDELVELLYGASSPTGGHMILDGEPFAPKSPAAAVKMGVGLVPADRVHAGGIPEWQVQDNLFLPGVGEFVRGGRIRRRDALAESERALARYRVVPPEPTLTFRELSGGNQQKVVLARWLRRDLHMLVLHEPTAGVDVGAREFLWAEIRGAARGGKTVIVVTSDIAEAAELCDRVAVLVDGRLVADLTHEQKSEERILAASLGAAHLAENDRTSAPETSR